MPSKSANICREEGDPASICPKCNGERVWKKASEVSWRQYCSPCHSRASFASRRLRREQYNKQVKHRRQNEPMFRAYELWHGAKCRASMRKIDFSLSRRLVEKALMFGYCAVTGLKFDLALKGKRMGSFSPSIDRIDPALGYSDQNCQVVCWLYNRAKGDGSHSDVLKLAEALNAVYLKKAA